MYLEHNKDKTTLISNAVDKMSSISVDNEATHISDNI